MSWRGDRTFFSISLNGNFNSFNFLFLRSSYFDSGTETEIGRSDCRLETKKRGRKNEKEGEKGYKGERMKS